MGDIDDLLDDMENKMGLRPTSAGGTPIAPATTQAKPAASSSGGKSRREELDSLLDDMGDTTEDISTTYQPKTSTQQTAPAPTQAKQNKKCASAKLGGPDTTKGYSGSSTIDNKCDRLLCTKCDFKVVGW
eukprot:TRINITY_DN67746_c6_g7_i2.p1 TRINITY_DN67746_c6_g7~~TRINITY_DN67746_c6_g7_i2.p1  ORF type:complete len:130 (-),score=24.29 TRINITY_DN67746_c6_g7_i2:149-538(-)